MVGSNRDLWKLVSESYVAKDDFDAAIRARWASFAVSDQESEDWRRMSELMEAAGHTEDALAAARRAEDLAIRQDAASVSRTSTSVGPASAQVGPAPPAEDQ